jgi:cyclopropane fatty-acyl-phospholipid synthase-like methyltransferase
VRCDTSILVRQCGGDDTGNQANVTGITISSYQVGRAEKLTKVAGLQDLVHFHTMDFTNTTFDDNVWDRVYAIEVRIS